MEPMVLFSAGLVVYCGGLTLIDAIRDRVRNRESVPAAAGKAAAAPKKLATSATVRRAGGAVARWTKPLTDSV